MTGAQAALEKTIQISDDGGVNYFPIQGDSASLNISGDVLDDTNFVNVGVEGYRSKCTGLLDWSAEVEAFYSGTNTAQTKIRTALTTKTPLKLQYLPDGVSGFEGDVIVSTNGFSGGIADLEKASFSFEGTGPLSVI